MANKLFNVKWSGNRPDNITITAKNLQEATIKAQDLIEIQEFAE